MVSSPDLRTKCWAQGWSWRAAPSSVEPCGSMVGLPAWSPPLNQPRTSYSPLPIRRPLHLSHPLSHQSSPQPPSNTHTHHLSVHSFFYQPTQPPAA